MCCSECVAVNVLQLHCVPCVSLSVRCKVLQYVTDVAVCCSEYVVVALRSVRLPVSVLQCVAVCCSVLQMLQYVAVSMLQCVAVSVLQ